MAGLHSILIVEDDGMIRELYQTALIQAGYSVEIASESNEAFQKLQNFHPDVILLDIMLPGLSGIDILKELRTNDKYGCKTTKIVMLTNLAQQSFADTAFALKANGYIIKADILPTDLDHIIKSLDKKKN